MLPRRYRLTSENDFKQILEAGKVIQGKLFGLAVAQGEEEEHPRVGIIVSNKISKKATERNRIKRAIQEGVYERLEKIPEGKLLAFLVKRRAVDASNQEIKKETREILEKVPPKE